MPPASPRSALYAGFRAGLPFGVVIVPFAAIFGGVAMAQGLDLAQVMGFSVLVIAGAAQFTALQLMTEGAPAALVVAGALAVNLRMVMYSAALAPHLGAAPLGTRMLIGYLNVDQSYTIAALEFERHPERPHAEKVAFFMGSMLPVAPMWYAGTLAGALAGARIAQPPGLDFVIPIAFLSLIAPALRTRAHKAAAVAAAAAGLALAWLPYQLGLIPAGLVGMVVGAEAERRGWAER